MGALLILGAQQILMVLGAQGAQTMNCTKAYSSMLEKQILCYPGIPVLTSEEVFNFVIVIFIQSEM